MSTDEAMKKLRELFGDEEPKHTKSQRTIRIAGGRKVIVEDKRRSYVCNQAR